ncbi:MAG: hypothetical protein RIT24_2653 [Planctomycetota bacterium]
MSGEGRRLTLAQRLSDLGRTRRFRIAVAAVFSLAILAVSVTFYREAARLDDLFARLPQMLANADLRANDPVAKQLVEKGTITIDGREVGDAALAKFMERSFEGTGRMDRVGEAAMRLIDTERRDWLPIAVAQEPWVALAGGALALAIVLFACWTDLALQLVIVSIAAGVLGGGTLAIGRPSMAASLAAIPLFLFMFSLVVRLLLEALDRPLASCAVASSVIRESVRQKVAISFAAIVIIAIPLLPQSIDPTLPLRYQVQTFLAQSLDTMYVICAFLTVFLGCATAAFEIRDRQAWTTLTKPVSRGSWLIGKWLGIVALNVAILLTASVTMFTFLAQMKGRPAQDAYDAVAVQEEVLVARVGGLPEYKRMTSEELQQAVETEMKSDPNIQADLRDGTRSEIEIKKALVRTITERFLVAQRTIVPNTDKVFTFSGLTEQRKAGGFLTLRYKFYAGESDPNEVYPVVFLFGTGEQQRGAPADFVAAQSNIIPVPASCIDTNGVLTVQIINMKLNTEMRPGEPELLPGKATVTFDPDGLEILYRVGGFGDNLVRAQMLNLLKLSFLGMLSVVCASVLSFPVACLVVFTVLAAGSLGPFLATSVEEYRIRTDSSALKAFEFVVKMIAGATEFTVRSFGEAKGNGPLVEGRLISWFDVVRTFALIGVAWSGLVLAAGVFAFRRKELAIYSGQGG